MAQTLKPQMRDRIVASALHCFAEEGYARTTVARIAAHAGTAPANVYRYFPSKEALFAAAVPVELAERHDALLDTRVAALADGDGGSAAGELLDFWLDHRLAVVILLDRAQGTPFADYPATFVRRMVDHMQGTAGLPPTPAQLAVLELVFDNTRRALARILHTATDRDQATASIAAFWAYQVPGLDGLLAHLAAAPADRLPPRQVLFIQGGGAGTHDAWDDKLVDSLRRALGPGNDVRYPRLPDEEDPSYARWSPAIRRELADLDGGAVVAGHSVGGTILIATLAEQPPVRELAAVVLIAAPFVGAGGWPAEDLALPDDLGARLPPGLQVHVFHGLDDQTVPPSHADLYARAIPQARLHLLPGRDHQLNDDLGDVAPVISAGSPGPLA